MKKEITTEFHDIKNMYLLANIGAHALYVMNNNKYGLPSFIVLEFSPNNSKWFLIDDYFEAVIAFEKLRTTNLGK